MIMDYSFSKMTEKSPFIPFRILNECGRGFFQGEECFLVSILFCSADSVCSA